MIASLSAFFLPLLLFLFWGIIGYPVLTLLSTRRHCLRTLLLSPTAGMAITLLPIFWLNRINIPIAHFAFFLTLGFLAVMIMAWITVKPILPYRQYAPFFGLLLAALCLIGWPLLRFDFHWVSFVNDDMNNYCLAAQRFLHDGYFTTPLTDDFVNGKNYGLYYWFFHVIWQARAGTELQLAWLSSVTGLSPLALFMPLIVALHLCLISAAGALVLQNRLWRKTALVVMGFALISPLIALSTLYQLIAQVGGIALLILLIIYLLHTFSKKRSLYALRYGVLLAIAGIAQFIYYPEVLIVAALSYFLFFIFSLRTGWRPTKQYALMLIIALSVAALGLIGYFDTLYLFLLRQINNATTTATTALFPYFLNSQGFGYLFGLFGIGETLPRHGYGIGILIGFLLCVVTLWYAFFETLKTQKPYAISVIVFFLLFIFLFIQRSGFSVFKVSLYAQPFLIATLVAAGRQHIKQFPKIIYLFGGILACINLYTHGYYLKRSLGTPGTFQELAYASSFRLETVFQKLIDPIPKTTAIAYCSPSLTLTKLLIQFNDHHASDLVSQPFLKTNFVDGLVFFKAKGASLQHAFLLRSALNKRFSVENFRAKGVTDNIFERRKHFFTNAQALEQPIVYIFPTALLDIINRTHFPTNTPLVALEKSQTQNDLIFIDSSLGEYYYFAKNTTHIGLFSVRNDVFYPPNIMQGIGQYLLFQIVSPTVHPRLLLSISSTALKNHSLPKAWVYGDKAYPLPLVGEGSARVISAPLSPQIIGALPYIMLHVQPPVHDNDPTMPVTLARNISLISEANYQGMHAPSALLHFPEDLKNPRLIYSGIFEDGRLSSEAYCYLTKPKNKNTLVLQGGADTIATITMFVNDKKRVVRKIKPGIFSIHVPVAEFSGTIKVGMKLTSRNVTAKIRLLTFEP